MPPANSRNSRSSRPGRPNRPSSGRPPSGRPSRGTGSRPARGTGPRPDGPSNSAPRPSQPRQPRPQQPRPEVPEFRTVTIDRIVGEGRGIGFSEGKTIFVPRTAPGDTVRANIIRKQGNVLHGELVQIIEPSPLRIEPRIADPDQSGGADLQFLPYEEQLTVKAGIIEDSLRRIAKLDDVPDIRVTPAPKQWEYRSRAEFQIDHENGRVGYFAPYSHRVVDVEESPILTPEVQVLLTALRDDVAAGIVPVGAKEYRAVAGDTAHVLEATATSRSKMVQTTVNGIPYQYTAECFFQANIPVATQLVKSVLRIANIARTAPGIAIDLYCGVGLFSVPLAKVFPRVIGVENHQAAATFAKENVATSGKKNARFVAAPVERWIAGDRSPLGKVALLVFDPPRTGAGTQVIDGIARMKPAHIAAVSCDPATFARDLRGLLDAGYALRTLEAFDMFPQTHHVELVAHLERIEA